MRTWRALGIAGSLALALLAALVLFGPQSRSVSANSISGLASISAGELQTCAVTTSGGVKCWGTVGAGGLQSSVPVDVAGLSSGLVAVSLGLAHQCALTGGGGVICWGEDYFGQLGSGGTRWSSTPVAVSGLDSGVAQISAGYEHTCAAITAGGVKCWGANDYGQLGDGTTHYKTVPVDVVGLAGAVRQVSAAVQHTCAVTAAGGVLCWGRNDYGQLGDGTAISRLTPVAVGGLDSGVVAVAGAYNYTCALTGAAGVKCWGLGYGRTPVDVPGLGDAIAIDAGSFHTCVVTQAGGVKCWGSNSLGQLGDGMACGPTCTVPVSVPGLSSGVTAVAAGGFHTCALAASGGAKCWGSNADGELGNGLSGHNGPLFSSTPVDVVQQDAKPTPTRTPCPQQGCPTPTPRPAPPRTGLDFSIAIDTNGDGVADCGTGAGQPKECRLAPGSVFQVVLSLNSLPADVSAYGAFDAALNFAGVQSDGSWTPLWPDCAFPAQSLETPDYFFFACTVGVKAPSSVYVGPLGSASFTCNGNGSVTLAHYIRAIGVGTDIFDDNIREHHELVPGETLAVTCGPLLRGDSDCNRTVDAADVTLTLQYEAKLVDSVGCPQQSDVNLDSKTNSIDGALTDQYDAKLIDRLPPQQLRP